MAEKRVLDGDDFGNDDNPQNQPNQDSLKFTNSSTKSLSKEESWLQRYSPHVEKLLRKAVREGAEHATLPYVQSSSRSPQNQAQLSDPRKFKLHFEGRLPDRLYAENKVEAEGPSPVKVVLLDALSGHIITDGPLSSLRVEIVPLQGHFKAEQLEDYQKEFNDNIVLARHGKRPLLLGERVTALRDGVGFINGIWFSDNSCWVRSKMFRLGARVFLAKEDQVREAVSNPFEVKDRRGEATKKKRNTDLSLEDEVWRLHKISKDGKICKRLAERQILKVKDFVQQFQSDPSILRSNLGLKPKMWEAIVQQATSCISSNVYNNNPSDIPSSSLPLQNVCVPAAIQDQINVPMSYNHGTQHSHQLDQPIPEPVEAQSMLIEDNFSVEELLQMDDSFLMGDPMAPSSSNGPPY